MARKRMIDPGFWTDEVLGQLDRTARLLFMGLISQADDEGRLRGNPALVKSQVFPYDEDLSVADIDAYLGLLHDQEFIVRYSVENQVFIWLQNFDKHQTINKPTPSKLPSPEDENAEAYSSSSTHVTEDSRSPTGDLPLKRKEVKLREEKCASSESNSTKTRKRDPIWDAFVELYGRDPNDLERGSWNKAVKSLRDRGVDSSEIPKRAEHYKRQWPDTELTPMALAKHWERFESDQDPHKPKERLPASHRNDLTGKKNDQFYDPDYPLPDLTEREDPF